MRVMVKQRQMMNRQSKHLVMLSPSVNGGGLKLNSNVSNQGRVQEETDMNVPCSALSHLSVTYEYDAAYFGIECVITLILLTQTF